MILEVLTDRFKRELIPINDAELETLERDGPRALNYMMSRGIRRLRQRFFAILRVFLFLLLCWYTFGWTGAGLLAFVIYSAALTVIVDAMRQGFAARWVFYSHSRADRAEDVLSVGASLESGDSLRPAKRRRPAPTMLLVIAGACTVVGLPLAWVILGKLGLASWDQVFANFFLPLFLMAISGWRLIQGYFGIRFAMGSTVGSRDLCLDSDDALDTYALALVLALLLSPFGNPGLVCAAFLVVACRLAAVAWVWWQQRNALALLQKRIYRTHPHSRVSKSEWDEEEAGEARRQVP